MGTQPNVPHSPGPSTGRPSPPLQRGAARSGYKRTRSTRIPEEPQRIPGCVRPAGPSDQVRPGQGDLGTDSGEDRKEGWGKRARGIPPLSPTLTALWRQRPF